MRLYQGDERERERESLSLSLNGLLKKAVGPCQLW